MNPAWTFERHEAWVGTLKLHNPKGKILFISDLHWDNKFCDRELLKKDLQAARDDAVPVFIVGDLYCAMQGKWDKRADQDQLRVEHHGNQYLDLLVETAQEFFLPYSECIAAITPGNHEQSILERHQTDLLGRLASAIGARGGRTIPVMAYRTFVKAKFSNGHDRHRSRAIYLHHGYGGGGEVTRGLIDNSRTRSSYWADIYVSGHIHRRNMDENTVIRMMKNENKIERLNQYFLRCGSYKLDGDDGSGWHTRTGKGPRPLGGWWLEYDCDKDGVNFKPVPTS